MSKSGSKVLIISGHPDLEQSYTNSVILEQMHGALDNVEIRRLDTLYSDYSIDIEAEQQALLSAQVVVLQFPFYWYSMPALLKKWMDDVFAFNFAYGAEGDKLKGKDLFLSFTVGGPQESYNPLGYNHFTIEQFLRPLQQTAYLAGMNYHKPVYTHSMVYIPGVYNKLEDVQARAANHANRLITDIQTIQNSAEEKIRRFVADWFAEFDQLPQGDEFFIQHLAPDVNWNMPEGKFKGHQGFSSWYEIARSTFKPGCDHQVEQIEVIKNESGYQVDLRIRMLAETFPDSQFNGEGINLLVNEIWQVSLDEHSAVTIHDYQVEPVIS
ncbi:NAD(P)H-dependent oxidoreductase [Bacterioplanoides sp.]|uniref:NAD(P)H-dependent oxidoreductase n=1 Tax=Bacterioplanoides sp. TaxID=2066072 RepID=UPI003B00D020